MHGINVCYIVLLHCVCSEFIQYVGRLHILDAQAVVRFSVEWFKQV